MSDQPLTPSPAPASAPSQPPPVAPAPTAPAPTPLHAAEGGIAAAAPEAPIWTGRTHWTHFAGSVALWLLGSVVIALACAWLVSRGAVTQRSGFLAAAALIAAFGLIVFVRILIRVLSVRYRLTTERLFIERGILSQVIDQTELVRVDDVRVRRSLWDRILGLGSVDVITTDVTDKAVVVEGVREPQLISEHIRERMRQLRRKSLYVENL